MKRILVDVDCVVADLMPEWLGFYNEEYEDQVKVEDIKSWGLEVYVKPECGTEIYRYLKLPYLYDNVQPIDGALSSVQWLRHRGYDVVFVTSGIHEGKAKWLDRYGFLLSRLDYQYAPDLVFAHDKSLIKGDIMIDDNVKNLHTFQGKSILFGQPWNDDNNGYFRAYNWPDVIQYLVRGL